MSNYIDSNWYPELDDEDDEDDYYDYNDDDAEWDQDYEVEEGDGWLLL